MPGKKTAVTLSVDDDVLKWFEAQGTEFQRGIANLRRSASGIARNAHLNQTNRFAGVQFVSQIRLGIRYLRKGVMNVRGRFEFVGQPGERG